MSTATTETGPALAGARHRFNLRVPVRDGALLATDLYLPRGDGPFPAVLGRTPYGKNNPGYKKLVNAWNGRGYALAIQDVRGRGDSEGEFTPYANDPDDGYDAIEWVAAQEWSDGNVLTQGASYGGRIGWLTALTRPPHLRAMICSVSPSDPFVEFPTTGESLMSISWYRLTDGRALQPVDNIDWMELYNHLPLETLDEAAGFSSPHWRDAVKHSTLDEYWRPLCYQGRFAELDIPVLHVSGWYDDEQVGTPLNYAGMVRGARSERARAGQRLLMGPWPHAINSTSRLGEVDFGPDGVIDLEGYMADFADAVLGRGAAAAQPPVRIFVMGINQWRDEDEWPLARTRFTDFFLHSEGAANSRLGNGRLDPSRPVSAEPADTYTCDPARPVPFITQPDSGQIGGPDDYSAIELRGDVLCYTSDPLEKDLELIGPVRLELYASSSAVDTDFMAKLVDVHPGGFCQRLCDGAVAARLREGVDHSVLMEPGTVYRFDIDMWNTCVVLPAGHRVRLEVSSSAFPKYPRNLNTGDDPATATRIAVAENQVWHDAERSSRLVLPVIAESA